MRYYSYNEPNIDGSKEVITVSAEEILEVYKPYFLEQVKRITRTVPDTTDEMIIDQWLVINWAWETDINGKQI